MAQLAQRGVRSDKLALKRQALMYAERFISVFIAFRQQEQNAKYNILPKAITTSRKF